jgi:NAD(P)-dependent dehydrogenase (short-subunit alcohol dehydrogenase family)
MIANRHLDRTVLVTGAASGIGRGIATRFGEEGASVVVADVRREPKQGEYYDTDVEQPTDEKITDETDGTGLYVETDVSDPDSVSNTVEEVVKEFGQLDVLINNAGIYVPGSSQEISTEDWQQVIDVNLTGHFNCAKYAIPHLVESEGHIVNMGSVMASEGGAGPSYTSAKAAIVNLTRDLAVELGEASVNVNAICPGFVETPIQDYQTEESLQTQLDHTLLPHGGVPRDVGNAAVFLASKEASFIHGTTLYVDGGWAAHRV